MLNVEIITIGKIKQKPLQVLIDEYLKRLRPFLKIKIHELKAAPFQNNKDSQRKSVQAEQTRIRSFLDAKNIEPKDIFLLDADGVNPSSFDFSTQLYKREAKKQIFIVGGALGFDNDFKNKFSNKISLSKMTFTHEMARVLLLEQVYRAVNIQNNKTYHY